VFAAASLKEALDAAVVQFGQPVTVSYGGSGLIARQVAQGAPADLVILAHADWMEWLTGAQGIQPVFQQGVLRNQLVVIGASDAADLERATAAELGARLGDGRMATGMTSSVPAGLYARQWLEHIGAWSALSGRLAETENVRAALALVARKEAPLGVVYASDALAQPGVRVLYHIPPETHDDIRYPMAVINGRNAAQAIEFAHFLLSPAGQRIFVDHGFLPAEATP
jgi:molybdate transport system substrate-binding protein